MTTLFVIFILLIWITGTWLRIYRQAHYYQIEEYLNQRYLIWLGKERMRWLPTRPVVVVVAATVIGLFLDTIPGTTNVLAFIIVGVAAVISVWPPARGEVKKPFVRTERATRMLGAAFVVPALAALLAFFFVESLSTGRSTLVLLSISGLLLFLMAPVWLMAGNLLMYPVETILRQRFQRQAQQVLNRIRPRVIGITGSYGKTTTKNYLSEILSSRYRTYATPKSYNTLMGISLAINRDLADDYSIEYFVCEMAMYGPGEIAKLCEFVPPDVSIVIEVGPQHLERAGSIENIAKAKYEIIQGLRPDGVGIFNWDNDYIKEMIRRGYPQHRIAVSRVLSPAEARQEGVRFIAQDINEELDGLAFTVMDVNTGQREAFSTPLVGIHNVTNLLLATAAAVNEGLSLRDVAYRVRTLQPAESRLVRQVADGGIIIINDSYSANPVGAVSALKVLGMQPGERKVLITPGMIELGDLHKTENKRLGQLAPLYATDIILVGEKQTKPVQEGILSTDFPPDRLHIVSTLSEATRWYQQNLRSGDAVLFLNDLPDTY